MLSANDLYWLELINLCSTKSPSHRVWSWVQTGFSHNQSETNHEKSLVESKAKQQIQKRSANSNQEEVEIRQKTTITEIIKRYFGGIKWDIVQPDGKILDKTTAAFSDVRLILGNLLLWVLHSLWQPFPLKH